MAKFFLCYAHDDNDSTDRNQKWLDRVLNHIKPLVRQGELEVWSDKTIKGGNFWKQKISSALGTVDAAILLVSPSFLASDFVRDAELPRLLSDIKQRNLEVIPLIIRPCLFDRAEFKYPDPNHGPESFKLSNLQSINGPNRALSGLSQHDQDVILNELGERLMEISNTNP